MEPIKDFGALMNRLRSMQAPCKVAFVCPDDEPSVETISHCLAERLVSFHLVVVPGRDVAARELAVHYPEAVEIHEAADVDGAAACAVELVRQGKAGVLMKGNINTDNLLRAVLNRDAGLLPKGNVMSHVSVTDIPGQNKLILFSDAAVIPVLTLPQMQAVVKNDVELARALGIECPRVALIHFSEKVNPKFQNTLDYETLKVDAANGMFGNAIVDGPMDVKTACDAHSGAIKGIVSPVGGDADILLFPNLEAANTFYKTVSYFCGAGMAGVLTGTSAPVVIPSRADAPESKLYSLALACVMAVTQSM